jgi:hypothetical protein
MSFLDKEVLIETLYEGCSLRSRTTKEVFEYIITTMNLIVTNQIEEKAIEIIRHYKHTGTDLETTVNLLYNILNANEWRKLL